MSPSHGSNGSHNGGSHMLQFTRRDVSWITRLIVIIFLVQVIVVSSFTFVAMQELESREARERIRRLGSSLGQIYGTISDRGMVNLKETLRKGYNDYTKKDVDMEGFAHNLGGNEQGFWWDFRTRQYMSTDGFPEPGEESDFLPQDTGTLKLYDAYVRFGYTPREAMIKVLREWEILYTEVPLY